jgi:hypothetical protein
MSAMKRRMQRTCRLLPGTTKAAERPLATSALALPSTRTTGAVWDQSKAKPTPLPALALFAFTFADCFVFPYLSASTAANLVTIFYSNWWLIVTSALAAFTTFKLYFALSLPLFLWTLALAASLGLRHYRPDPDPDPRANWSRKQKLAELYRLRHSKPCTPQHPSIRTANLHPKYPLKQRSMGHFVKAKAPTVDHRLRETTFVVVMDQVCKLLFKIRQSTDRGQAVLAVTTCVHHLALKPVLRVWKHVRLARKQTRRESAHEVVRKTNIATSLLLTTAITSNRKRQLQQNKQKPFVNCLMKPVALPRFLMLLQLISALGWKDQS